MPTSDEILAQLNSGPAPSSDEILARLNSPTGDLGGETPEAREFLRRRQRELGPEAVPTGQIEERSIPIPDAGDPGISVGDVAADAAAQINQGVAFLADPAARVALGPAYYLPPVKRGLEALSRRADKQREETSRALEERAQSAGGEMAARAASFATSLAADPLNLIPGAAVLRRAGRAAGTARQGTARSDEVGRFLSKYTDTGAASEGAKGTTVLESLTGDFYQRWVSREAPLEKIAPDLVQRKRGAKAIARAPIYDYTFRFDRELGRNIPTGEPLADIVSGLSGEAVDDLRAFMLARRDIELAERAAKGENLRISEQAIEDGKKVLAEIDGAGKTEVLEELHRRTVEWADKAILQPLEEVGVILPEDRAVMRGSNIDYAPMLRAAREEVDEMIHRIHGGLGDAPDEKVIDPLQALIVKAQKVQIFAENQRVRNALVEWADNNPDALDEIRGATATEALRGDSTINYWRNGEKKSFKVNKQLAQALDLHTPGSLSFTLRALESNPFWKAMKGAASALRAGATLTVDFAFRNLFRDQFGAAIYSKYGYVPYEGIIRGIFKAFGKGDKYEQLWRAHGGDLSAMVSPDRPQAMATLQDITASSVPEKAKKVMSKWRREGILYPLQVGSEALEGVTRKGVAQRGIRRAESGKGLPVLPSIDEAVKELFRTGSLRSAGAAYKKARKEIPTFMEAIEDSRQASLDFARQGTVGGQWNMVEAFINAEIQDVDKFFRVMKERPITTTVRAMGLLTMPKLWEYYQFEDDPEWHNREEWEHALFLAVGKREGGGFIQVPMPIGLPSLIFGYIIPKSIRAASEDDPNFYAELREQVRDRTPLRYGEYPEILPTAAQPLAESFANYSEFRDRDIVPQNLQGVRPEEQFMETTSPAIRRLAQIKDPTDPERTLLSRVPFAGPATEGSPILFEELIGQQFGTLGRNALKIADLGLRAVGMEANRVRRQINFDDIPLLGAFLSPPRFGPGTKPVNEFWDNANRIDMELATFRKIVEEGRVPELSEKQKRLMSLDRAYGKARDHMRVIYAARRALFSGEPRVLSDKEELTLTEIDRIMTMHAASTNELARMILELNSAS